jgi:hypothetical protein
MLILKVKTEKVGVFTRTNKHILGTYFIVLGMYYCMFAFYCIVLFTFHCIVLYYCIALLYRFCLY